MPRKENAAITDKKLSRFFETKYLRAINLSQGKDFIFEALFSLLILPISMPS
jgi:hypothetical protein